MLEDIALEQEIIATSLKNSRAVIDRMVADGAFQSIISDAIAMVCQCLQRNGKILFAGNGGSAADAQHMSAEYVARFMFDRPGLASIALTTDTSALTAIGNDYGFEQLFSRQIEALGQKGDVLFAYSTSGTSPNIVAALEEAKRKGVKTIGMTGMKPQSQMMVDMCDVTIRIPSDSTPYIQEGHLVVGHLICLGVEQLMFPDRVS